MRRRDNCQPLKNRHHTAHRTRNLPEHECNPSVRAEAAYEEGQALIRHNISNKLEVEITFSDMLKTGTHVEYNGDEITGKREVFSLPAFVHQDTGEILAIGQANNIDQEIIYGENTAEATIHMPFAYPEYSPPEMLEENFKLWITGPYDEAAQDYTDLSMCVSVTAQEILEASIEVYNEQVSGGPNLQ